MRQPEQARLKCFLPDLYKVPNLGTLVTQQSLFFKGHQAGRHGCCALGVGCILGCNLLHPSILEFLEARRHYGVEMWPWSWFPWGNTSSNTGPPYELGAAPFPHVAARN